MTEQEYLDRAEALKGRLYRTAALYLGSPSAAVDAVDEAVYRAFRDRRKLRQPEFFETWLTRILINVCKDELRRRRRECRVCVPPEPEAEHMDALSLREAVRALPEELRSVIVLRYFTGLTLEETASVMAAPFWSTIERMEPQEAERLTYLRKVFPSLLLTGPFSIILGFSGGLMALNDRLKLRSMVVGEKDDRVFISSEEAAIRVMEPDAENIWAPMGGEPVIVRLKEGTY